MTTSSKQPARGTQERQTHTPTRLEIDENLNISLLDIPHRSKAEQTPTSCD